MCYFFIMKGSWTESIKNRFKHVRKYENKKRSSMAQSATDDNQPSTCAPKPTLKRLRKADIWNEIPHSGNTTEAIQKEHISELHKETQKSASSQDKNKVKTLMASTFPLRKEILTTLTPVSKIIETYPPLVTISGVSSSIWPFNPMLRCGAHSFQSRN
jgi:chromatin remodeling complex protein RSC6